MAKATEDFTWRDGERTVVFREGAILDAPEALAFDGWGGYELLSTQRALTNAPIGLINDAVAVHEVEAGPVNELAGVLYDRVKGERIVALGGGRVIDTAKAIAAVKGGSVTAMPTTLSGAEMTAIHRLPQGHTANRLVRPGRVFADPVAMTGLDDHSLRASAMNALAHGADSLYTPLANPLSRLAALRGAKLIATALDGDALAPADRRELALGSLLCSYALDSALFSLHHVICQTLVRTLCTPHAETNAAILPRAIEALIPRVPVQMTDLARALGTKRGEMVTRIEHLAGGRRQLGELGADRADLDAALDGILDRGELGMTPDAPDRDELRALIESAW